MHRSIIVIYVAAVPIMIIKVSSIVVNYYYFCNDELIGIRLLILYALNVTLPHQEMTYFANQSGYR